MLPRTSRLVALVTLLALVIGCKKRASEAPDPEPEQPPTAAVRPDPKPPEPPAPKPKPPEPKPDPKDDQPAKKADPSIKFQKPTKVQTITLKTPFSLDLKATTGPTANESIGKLIKPSKSYGAAGMIRALPGGKFLVRYGTTLVTIDPATGAVTGELAVKDVFDIQSYAVSRDGRRAAATIRNMNGRSFVAGFDLVAQKELWRERTSTGVARDRATFSPDGRKVYLSPAFPSGYEPKSERLIIDAETGKVLERNLDDRSPALVAYPDGAAMLGAGDGGMGVWDEKFKHLGHLMLFDDKRASWAFKSVVVSPAGRLVAWSGDERVVIASTETGEVRHHVRLIMGPGEPAFSFDDRWLLLGQYRGGDGTALHLIDTTTGKEVLRLVTSETHVKIGPVACSTDGATFVALIDGAVHQFPLPNAK